MTRPRGANYETVDLLSDSKDEELLINRDIDWHDAREFANLNESEGHSDPSDADEFIDLTAIPDIDVPPSDPIDMGNGALEPHAEVDKQGGDAQLVTEAACLQIVLSVLPDISIDHVLKVIGEKTTEATRTMAQCETIITRLLDGGVYPKEADDTKNTKRKREDEESMNEYEKAERDPMTYGYGQDALLLLKDEFPNIPVRHITNVLKEHNTLFKAFGVLQEQLCNYRKIALPFTKVNKARKTRGAERILIERGSQLPKELHAARKREELKAAKRHKAEETKQIEEANLQRAQMNNTMGECACCFNDVPLNRMISCNGTTSHFYCKDCPRQQIETQMGQSRCRPKCFGVDDCDGTFSRSQLQQVLCDKTFDRLEHMQQLEELKAAGLDFLSECPFCDFKMECLPVEIDREFRCQSDKCGKTSCRLCNKETHIPLTCDEASKDGQLTSRHVVEEAMSAALIRHCVQCKHPFVKEAGCNKMTCTHCRNVQCYVCSKKVTDYQHFGEAGTGKCPLHENVEDRHEQEVKKAADEAMIKVRADNPHLSNADLMIKVSDRVKQAEDARKGQAAFAAGAFPYHMVDGMIRNRHHQPGAGPFPVAAPLPLYEHPAVPPYVHPYPAVAPAPHFIPPMHRIQFGLPVGYMGPAPMVQPYQPAAYHALVNPLPHRLGAAPPQQGHDQMIQEQNQRRLMHQMEMLRQLPVNVEVHGDAYAAQVQGVFQRRPLGMDGLQGLDAEAAERHRDRLNRHVADWR